MEIETLDRLFERLKALFPPEAPLRLLPSAGPEAWAAVAARSAGKRASARSVASSGWAPRWRRWSGMASGSLSPGCLSAPASSRSSSRESQGA